VGGRAAGGDEEARRRRLAAALRENLKRRKAQARGRAAPEPAEEPAVPTPGGAAESGRGEVAGAAAASESAGAAAGSPAGGADAADGVPAVPGGDEAADEPAAEAEDAGTWRVRLVAGELEAERIAALIERAVEAEGWPVTRFELPPAVAGGAGFGVSGGPESGDAGFGVAVGAGSGGPASGSSASGAGRAVEAGAGAPAFAARLLREEEWPWAVEVLVFGGSAAAARARILDAVGGDGFAAPVTVEPLPEEDWVAKSLEGLPAVREGRFLVRGRHARGDAPAGAVVVEIEAGLAFGTGHHATTVGCLAAIERTLRRRRPRRPLDLGTGTGVLAIALARLAKVAVTASDIDPVAVGVAAANARGNGVGPCVRPFRATGMADRRLAGPFDFVVANILARPLESLAPAIGRALAPRATVVLSGLRVPDGRRIEAAYRRQGLVLLRRDARDGWLTLTFERRA
jgi:ribosomal protein L11 methyltransferase